MQQEHVLKKLTFDLLTPSPGSGDGCLRAKYLLLCCYICHSLSFDMQHDNILKKCNVDLFTPIPGLGGRLWESAAKFCDSH